MTGGRVGRASRETATAAIETARRSEAGVSVDVWIAELDENADAPSSLTASLSPAEVARARRYRFASDARRFALSHAALRLVLARYAHVAPHALVFSNRCRFCGGGHGRPTLVGIRDRPDFNMARTAGSAIIAVAYNAVVGCDVEHLDRASPSVLGDEMGAAVLCECERRALEGANDVERRARVLSCWCRKEAVLKAAGQGLAFDPRSLVTGVAVDPPTPVRLRGRRGFPASNWYVRDLVLPEEYVGAVAASAPILALNTHEIALGGR